ALFLLCLGGVWYVNRLQSKMASILADNISSMKAALQLEAEVRLLRFHSFIYFHEPGNDLFREIDHDDRHFRRWLQIAVDLAFTPEEKVECQEIERQYNLYEEAMRKAREKARNEGSLKNIRSIEHDYPIMNVVRPIRNYGQINEKQVEALVG